GRWCEHLNFRRMDEAERRSIRPVALKRLIREGLIEVMGLSPARYRVTKLGKAARSLGGEVVRRRRGGPRKAGRRKRSGDLVVRPDKPAAIAATMRHRRALGEKAVDQLAESELGRLALRRARAGAGDRRGGLCARAFALPSALVARRRQQWLKDGRGAES